MAVQYIFRHLDKSDFIVNFAKEHVEKILSRHSQSPDSLKGMVKFEMENSPQHPGKDVFCCEILLQSPQHGSIVVKKRTSNIYEAISLASDRLAAVIKKINGRFRARRRRKILRPVEELQMLASSLNPIT